jgi:MFS transporter, Spinster family, sphingosine-1-phosphate transporter
METSHSATRKSAVTALVLLLGINLFNYIDRYVLYAVEPSIRATFFAPGDRNAMAITGLLPFAFIVTYMLAAPALGWLADRFSRWIIIGTAVIFWSVACAASGIAGSIMALFITRIFVGIGEGAYGPAAPPIISDLFPLAVRGRILAIFFAAIPVGSALGYALGGAINIHFGWRWAFYLVAAPGLVLGLFCFFQKDPRVHDPTGERRQKASRADYIRLLRTPSYVYNIFAQTAMTFALGGLAFCTPAYLLEFRHLPGSATVIFGGIVMLAGLVSTLAGGFLADRLRTRFSGSYFLVSGIGMLIGFPLVIALLYTPFPYAWILLFGAMFFIFFNTGPANTALANVSLPSVRATAFALNILVIHALGDAIAPFLLGWLAGHSNLNVAFFVVSTTMLLSGVLWLMGMKYLDADTAAVEAITSEK